MSGKNRKLALIFDFDETLVADSVTRLLRENQIDADEFWDQKHASLIEKGWDPTAAYMMLLVNEMKKHGKLKELTPRKLRQFGQERLQLFEGVEGMFAELRELVGRDVTIQFFVISGGLQEVIRGTPIAKKLTDYWGCTLDDGKAVGVPYPKNVITFTEKTKYLFQINKGFVGAQYKNKPYEVNEFVEEQERAIPLENMIYIGDGLTDVPCFSILKAEGCPIVVYHQREDRRVGLQRAVKIARHRPVHGPYSADYTEGSDLRNCLDEVCRQMANGTWRLRKVAQ